MADASATTNTAWISAGSALAGVLIGQFGQVFTSFFTSKRERESRLDARRDAAKQRQNEFQGETLRSLQDASERLFRIAEHLHLHNLSFQSRHSVWSSGDYPSKLALASGNAYIAVSRYGVRVLDESVRRNVVELLNAYASVRFVGSYSDSTVGLSNIEQELHRLTDLIGARLRALDDCVVA